MKDNLTVGLITLGCAKNQVDSEYMLSDLEKAGFALTEDLSDAVAIVINTCAFIQPAKEESIETILEAARYKETGRCRVLAVVGCMAARYRDALRTEMPEVDIFLGVGDEEHRLGDILARKLGLKPTAAPGIFMPRQVRTISEGWAYLKISEGCDNRCSYCAIPRIRGNLASRPVEALVEEARFLESLGIVELNLIAQDTTAYGTECSEKGAPRLVNLLELLLDSTSIPWFRLLYTHPAHLEESLLEFMAVNHRIVPYLDMPIQHASDRILAMMGRKVTRSEIQRKIELARAILGDPILRTTVLVGFPGETERDFEELLDFIQEMRFHRLGGFIYSREEGTAAYDFRGSVSRAEKERRLEMILEIQRSISAELNSKCVGKVLPVLVERTLDPSETQLPEFRLVGRSRAHAPEVDGAVYLAGERLAAGTITEVLIRESSDYDLFGTAA